MWNLAPRRSTRNALRRTRSTLCGCLLRFILMRAMPPKKTARKKSSRPRKTGRAEAAKKTVDCPIVGIGGSAGGFEATMELLRHLPAKNGMTFVVVQHLDPHHVSKLASLLGRATAMPVN